MVKDSEVARLYEYQSKQILKAAGIPVPRGEVVLTPDDAGRAAEKIGVPVVLKIQVWLTGRAGLGGIQYADSPEEAAKVASELLGKKVKNFVVEKILVEEKLRITAEYFAGLVIDDVQKCPLLLFSAVGGSGIEEAVRHFPDKVVRIPVDVRAGLQEFQARNGLRRLGIKGKLLVRLSNILTRLYAAAKQYDARSLEVNPLVLTEDGVLYAADCHLTVDDYAVFRHPELGIEVAREFDRPATELEKIAYKVEEKDYRGTFYFFQMADEIGAEQKCIGFHGAGGGGSMMSMDAVLGRGFELANFCDTSGNPPASKVYRAAKIILSQPNIRGYFASGSGVASQEQFHSARGMVKAFVEENMEIPGVIRLGGNYEEKAKEILENYLKDIPAVVEGYGREDSPEFCARRLEELIDNNGGRSHQVRMLQDPVLSPNAYSFDTKTGKLTIDHEKCSACRSRGCIEACIPGILKLEENKPVLSISREEAAKGKCTECLACEIFCRFNEQAAVWIDLPIEGLKEYREKICSMDRRRKT